MRLTKKQIETFKIEAHKWIDRFGLKAWWVYWKVEPMKDDLATCAADPIARAVTIAIADDWPKSEIKDIKRVAFHEVGHILFTRINALAMYRHTTEDEIDEEIHALIRILEVQFYS